MATIRDQVYTYCEENKRLFSNLTKNQIAKRVSKDLGVSHNTASSYVNDYYKNFYEDTKVDNSLSDDMFNSMKEAFEQVGIVSEESKEEVKEDHKEEVRVETKAEVKEEQERSIIENSDRTTLNVGFMSGTNYMGRFELTAYKVIQYVPQGKDENGNRKESAKLFFENEDDLDTFYRDMKKLFQLQKIIKGDE